MDIVESPLRAYALPLLLFVFLLLAIDVQSAELPKPHGFVSDFADVIASPDEQNLENVLTRLEQVSGIEIAVVTIDSVPDGDVDTYAVRLFEAWGIGKKGQDEGLLILAAIQDRRARIEVGYGLEPIVPDAFAGRVLREVIFPRFKQHDYGGGLVAGTLTVVQRITEAKEITLPDMPQYAPRATAPPQPAGPLVWLFRLILLVAAIILFIKHPFLFLFLFGFGGRGGGISRGGFSGGGFGGFGGGLSGGGGASGSW